MNKPHGLKEECTLNKLAEYFKMIEEEENISFFELVNKDSQLMALFNFYTLLDMGKSYDESYKFVWGND